MVTKKLIALAIMASPLVAQPEAKTFEAADGTEVLYRFAAPEKTEDGKSYPLVLFLHGAGERGTDNKAQLEHGAPDILRGAADLGQPVYLIAPQCPPEKWWAEPTQDRHKLKGVPIRIFHGDADEIVPPEGSKIMAEALDKAGADVELTLYPGVGHNSWTRTYRDPEAIGWLFAQKKAD